MAKTYLNKHEQEDLWTLAAINSWCKKKLNQSKKTSPGFIRKLKFMRGCSEKAMDELLEEVPQNKIQEYVERLSRRKIYVK